MDKLLRRGWGLTFINANIGLSWFSEYIQYMPALIKESLSIQESDVY